MTINTILTIVLIVATVLLLGVVTFMYFRNKTLDEIRVDAYNLFLKAEQNPEFTHAGKQKMKWVLSQVRDYLPAWLKPFISDKFLEDIVQFWFDSVKDLLDDGKINKSSTKEE